MARLNDDAQWIVLMGFIVSFSLFFLAIVLNQSTVVGQTTAEAVSEFPKYLILRKIILIMLLMLMTLKLQTEPLFMLVMMVVLLITKRVLRKDNIPVLTKK